MAGREVLIEQKNYIPKRKKRNLSKENKEKITWSNVKNLWAFW